MGWIGTGSPTISGKALAQVSGLFPAGGCLETDETSWHGPEEGGHQNGMPGRSQCHFEGVQEVQSLDDGANLSIVVADRKIRVVIVVGVIVIFCAIGWLSIQASYMYNVFSKYQSRGTTNFLRQRKSSCQIWDDFRQQNEKDHNVIYEMANHRVAYRTSDLKTLKLLVYL